MITLTGEDQQLLSDEAGNLNFSLEDESSYLLVATKGDLYGTFTGTVDNRDGKNFKMHQLIMSPIVEQQLPIGGVISNADGVILDEVIITVTDRDSGDTIEAVINCIL